MKRYSVQPRDQIFLKGYECLSFARNMGKNIGKNLISKYIQKLLYHAKQSAMDALKTASQRAIQKTAEATGVLVENEIAGKITRASNTSHRIIQKQMKNKILKEGYISPKERQKIIDDLRLI